MPEAIQRQFWELAGSIRTFTVASDRDVLPWELLYPINDRNDNGFLVEQFPVVRRVYRQGRSRDLRISSAAYVVPPNSPVNALDEVRAVQARLGGGVTDRRILERYDELVILLESVPNLLHFACHNAFTPEDGSSLPLLGGPLRPSDLTIAAQKRSMASAGP